MSTNRAIPAINSSQVQPPAVGEGPPKPKRRRNTAAQMQAAVAQIPLPVAPPPPPQGPAAMRELVPILVEMKQADVAAAHGPFGAGSGLLDRAYSSGRFCGRPSLVLNLSSNGTFAFEGQVTTHTLTGHQTRHLMQDVDWGVLSRDTADLITDIDPGADPLSDGCAVVEVRDHRPTVALSPAPPGQPVIRRTLLRPSPPHLALLVHPPKNPEEEQAALIKMFPDLCLNPNPAASVVLSTAHYTKQRHAHKRKRWSGPHYIEQMRPEFLTMPPPIPTPFAKRQKPSESVEPGKLFKFLFNRRTTVLRVLNQRLPPDLTSPPFVPPPAPVADALTPVERAARVSVPLSHLDLLREQYSRIPKIPPWVDTSIVERNCHFDILINSVPNIFVPLGSYYDAVVWLDQFSLALERESAQATQQQGQPPGSLPPAAMPQGQGQPAPMATDAQMPPIPPRPPLLATAAAPGQQAFQPYQQQLVQQPPLQRPQNPQQLMQLQQRIADQQQQLRKQQAAATQQPAPLFAQPATTHQIVVPLPQQVITATVPPPQQMPPGGRPGVPQPARVTRSIPQDTSVPQVPQQQPMQQGRQTPDMPLTVSPPPPIMNLSGGPYIQQYSAISGTVPSRALPSVQQPPQPLPTGPRAPQAFQGQTGPISLQMAAAQTAQWRAASAGRGATQNLGHTVSPADLQNVQQQQRI